MDNTVISYTDELGFAAPRLQWVPSPTHVLRRAAVLDVLGKAMTATGGVRGPAKVLDMGCGAGTLLLDLARLGFTGKGIDISAPARELAKRIHAASSSQTVIAPAASEADLDTYDVVVALEVLEHVPDDFGAVLQWSTYLKRGGRMIVSVPAHPRMWGASDVWAGHVRRYERERLERLFANAGLALESIISYGFPVSNFLRPVSNASSWLKGKERQKVKGELKPAEATADSGIDRSMEKRLFSVYASGAFRIMFRAFFSLQKRCYETDLGTGYIAVGVRS
jgi:SAM-dependent methyltransferase